ncbi:MAG TPA: hypothetical protein PKA00_22520 [Saprospiraceae bacterium]|nr:hypothetical protein [Saprospiraceae bacterium]HMQ85703.1 hypothetical protein [Saprospiraceae bacterium]
MKKFAPLVSFLILLALGCTKDNREKLFDLVYPNFRFNILAGTSTFPPGAYELRGVETDIDFYLSSHSVDSNLIFAMNPTIGTLTAENGIDFDFLDAVSVRICEDTEEPCPISAEVFYREGLFQDRPGTRINLDPGLRNVRADLLRERYRLDIVVNFVYPPPFTVEARLDLGFQAVK